MLFSTPTEAAEAQGRDEAMAESGAAFIFSPASQGPSRGMHPTHWEQRPAIPLQHTSSLGTFEKDCFSLGRSFFLQDFLNNII